jgi:hypothetical protein
MDSSPAGVFEGRKLSFGESGKVQEKLWINALGLQERDTVFSLKILY